MDPILQIGISLIIGELIVVLFYYIDSVIMDYRVRKENRNTNTRIDNMNRFSNAKIIE